MISTLLTHGVLFIIMASVYAFSSGGFAKNFTRVNGTEKPGVTDVIYFTATVHTTTGFGDILATTTFAKIMTTIHMVLVFSFLILGV